MFLCDLRVNYEQKRIKQKTRPNPPEAEAFADAVAKATKVEERFFF